MFQAHPFFDDEARRRIAAAVQREEARSLGEIVPVVVDRSDSYPEAQDRAGILALALATALGLLLPVQRWELVALQALAFALGWLAGGWAPLARVVVGRRALDATVRSRAELAFREQGLARTAHGRGVLLFASLFEHEVVVLGDQEVHGRLGDEAWRDAVAVLVSHIRQRRPADGFVEAIAHIGQRLAIHFPRGPGAAAPSELPDHLTVR